MQLACMFPGQGSQSLGMLKSIADSDDIIMSFFSQAREVLGVDYWGMLQGSQEEPIHQTINTQVLMLISDVAMYHFLNKQGMPHPVMMAGHSLGEYAALVCGDAIDFSDALHLVFNRAQFMQQAVSNLKGAMAAIIGLENDIVEEICDSLSKQYPDSVLEPANYNAPGQIVIAGHYDAVEASLSHFEAKGAKLTKILPVSVPCHCRLMRPAADAFSEVIATTPMSIPKVKLISNVNAAPYESVEQMKTLLVQQLFMPVRWTETLNSFKNQAVTHLMECGPGKVLSGLAKRTTPELKNLFCFETSHLPKWDNI